MPNLRQAALKNKGATFVVSVLGVALVLSLFGVGTSSAIQPVLEPGRASPLPLDPWSPAWDSTPAVTAKSATPNTRRLRLATIRALEQGTTLWLLVEWPDTSPDVSFEGAYYPSTVQSPVPKVQQSTLLRDELTVWLGRGQSSGPRTSVLNDLPTIGYWEWRSQWQTDKDRQSMTAVKKTYGVPYVNYYPVEGDGAYPARFVNNTNTITDSKSSCKWTLAPARDVYTPAVTRPLDGDGIWRDGKWRVMFRAPLADLPNDGRRWEIVLSIADGGMAEQKHERTVTEPITIAAGSPRGQQGGGER